MKKNNQIMKNYGGWLSSGLLVAVVTLSALFQVAMGQTTVTIKPTTANAKSAYLYSYTPTAGYPTSQHFNAGYNTITTGLWHTVNVQARSYIQFDLSSIPANAIISSAYFNLFDDSIIGTALGSGSNSTKLSVVTQPWTRDSITWNNQPAVSTAYDVIVGPTATATDNKTNINVLAPVQYWVANPSLNNGWRFWQVSEGTTIHTVEDFASSYDSTRPAKTPYLQITYTVPTACTDSLVIQADTSLEAFAYMYDYSPNTAFVNSTHLNAGYNSISGVLTQARSYLKFNLSAIPAGASITGANLSFYHDAYNGSSNSLSGSNSTQLSVVNQPWSMSTIKWNTQPTVTTNYNVVVGPTTSNTAGIANINVTAPIQYWVTNPTSNFGWRFWQVHEYTTYRSIEDFASRNDSNPNIRPRLVVYYTCSGSTCVPGVSISDSTTGQCSPVTFTAVPNIGGTNPIYRWYKNSTLLAGDTTATFNTSALNNGDTIYVVMTSNAPCASGNPIATSNKIIVQRGSCIPYAGPNQTICQGSTVTMAAAGTGTWVALSTNPHATTIANTTSATTTVTGFTVAGRYGFKWGTAPNDTMYLTVNPSVTPSVSLTGITNVSCGGTAVFAAGAVNGGTSPTFTWYVNGTARTASLSDSLVIAGPTNGETVSVKLTSNAACLTSATATSITDTIHVSGASASSVSILANHTTLCSSFTKDTFYAQPVNGGSTPFYSWFLNGTPVFYGTNASTFIDDTIHNNDVVMLYMHSSQPCASPDSVYSAPVTVTVTNCNATPTVTLGGAFTGCGGYSPYLQIWASASGLSGSQSSYTYTWYGISYGYLASSIPGDSIYTINTTFADSVYCIVTDASGNNYRSETEWVVLDFPPQGTGPYFISDTVYVGGNLQQNVPFYYNSLSSVLISVNNPDGSANTNFTTDNFSYVNFIINNATIADTGLYTVNIVESSGINSYCTYLGPQVQIYVTVLPVLTTQDTVWPGDADANKLVDNNDLLPIGLAYDTTGPVRTVQGIVWQGDVATNWANYFTAYAPVVNFNNADCNGDGIVNADDTLAVVTNFGDIHAKTNSLPGPWRSGIPGITLSFSTDTVLNGGSLITSIIAGDSLLAIQNLYGLAFTLNYDPIVVDTNNLAFAFTPSWLGNASNSININRNFNSGTVKAAITGINHVARTGYGKIATFTAVITTGNINGKNLSYYTNHSYVSDITAIDQHGNPIQLNSAIDSNYVGYTPNGIEPVLAAANISIAPNPAATVVKITADQAITGITLTNMLGEEVAVIPVNGKHTENVNITNLATGVYVVHVAAVSGVVTAKLVVGR